MIRIISKLVQTGNNTIEINTSANGGPFKTQITSFNGDNSESKVVKHNIYDFEKANNKHDEIVEQYREV